MGSQWVDYPNIKLKGLSHVVFYLNIKLMGSQVVCQHIKLMEDQDLVVCHPNFNLMGEQSGLPIQHQAFMGSHEVLVSSQYHLEMISLILHIYLNVILWPSLHIKSHCYRQIAAFAMNTYHMTFHMSAYIQFI